MRKRILLDFSSPKKFTSALVETLTQNNIPVLAQNNQSGRVFELKGSVDQVLDDGCFFDHRGEAEIFQMFAEVEDSSKLVLYTSGTTSNPKMVEKTIGQLRREIVVLKKVLLLPEKSFKFYSSVSHQHIYGLLFSVLLPLSLESKRGEAVVQYPNQLQGIDSRGEDFVFISSPGFLKRLGLGKSSIRNCQRVLSSGGYLADEIAKEVHGIFNQGTFEFYGSTETGGIGFRRHVEAEDDKWMPLPGVNLSNNGSVTCLRSPFVQSEIELQDDIEIFESGRFNLHGRLDRIVKVEEKRLSLDDIESRLLDIEDVEDVACSLVESGRQSLACVLVLSDLGKTRLNQMGKRNFVVEIRQRLLPYFEPVLIPRMYRFVDSLSRNSESKLTANQVQELMQ